MNVWQVGKQNSVDGPSRRSTQEFGDDMLSMEDTPGSTLESKLQSEYGIPDSQCESLSSEIRSMMNLLFRRLDTLEHSVDSLAEILHEQFEESSYNSDVLLD